MHYINFIYRVSLSLQTETDLWINEGGPFCWVGVEEEEEEKEIDTYRHVFHKYGTAVICDEDVKLTWQSQWGRWKPVIPVEEICPQSTN